MPNFSFFLQPIFGQPHYTNTPNVIPFWNIDHTLYLIPSSLYPFPLPLALNPLHLTTIHFTPYPFTWLRLYRHPSSSSLMLHQLHNKKWIQFRVDLENKMIRHQSKSCDFYGLYLIKMKHSRESVLRVLMPMISWIELLKPWTGSAAVGILNLHLRDLD